MTGTRGVQKNIQRHSRIARRFLTCTLIFAAAMASISCAGLPGRQNGPSGRISAGAGRLDRDEQEIERAPREAGLPWRNPVDPAEQEVVLPASPLPERVVREQLDRRITRIIASMPLEARIGQLFVPAIVYDAAGAPVEAVTPEIADFMRSLQPGGVILFGPNLNSPDQTRELIRGLQEISDLPLFIAIDQEGGLVDRLSSNDSMGAIPIPSARRVGATGDEDLAYELARVVARELRSLGINMNMAPVADVMTNPDNPVIGSRAFGTTPELVATMVQATVRGYADEGIISVLKHFPGHGDTFEDTHYSSAVVLHDRERLEQIELVPFTAGISAGADAVLSGHMSVPALQGDNLPATFSSVILTDLLRGELGFEGVIITDALIMGSLVHYYPESQVCRRAFMAG